MADLGFDGKVAIITGAGGDRDLAVESEISHAGILRDTSFKNMGPEQLEPVLDVHLKGAFYVTQPAWEHMREQSFGRIICTASGAGIFGNFGQTNYGAAKMGLVGL